jgi:hypothetical protein
MRGNAIQSFSGGKWVQNSGNLTKLLQLLITIMVLFLLKPVGAAEPLTLQNDNIAVVYEPSLARAAENVIQIYPRLRQALEEFFGWNFDIRPQVVLVNDAQTFQKLSRSNFFVAYAVPDRNLIVIDYSKMNIRPFTLDTTLKHELCHLLLHLHIESRDLPKWVDEGVCQWVSDGIGELFVDKGWSGLDAAVMAGRGIPLRRLTEYFPRDKASLILAYEQSKSVINYIDRQYGKHAILDILNNLRNGEDIETALNNSLGLSVRHLEREWRENLESTPRWLVFLANHMYAILFFLAAVLSFFGFIRLLIKRRKKYKEWEEEDDRW